MSLFLRASRVFSTLLTFIPPQVWPSASFQLNPPCGDLETSVPLRSPLPLLTPFHPPPPQLFCYLCFDFQLSTLSSPSGLIGHIRRRIRERAGDKCRHAKHFSAYAGMEALLTSSPRAALDVQSDLPESIYEMKTNSILTYFWMLAKQMSEHWCV